MRSRLIFSIIVILGTSLTIFAQAEVRNTDFAPDKTLKSNARINPSTLAMELSVPLGVYPGRAGNSMPVTFDYTSKVWNISLRGSIPAPNQSTITQLRPTYSRRMAAGWTSSLSVPHIAFEDPEKDIYMGPDGPQGFILFEGQNADQHMDTSGWEGAYELYYIKRVNVTLADGSSHEFRASELPIYCGMTDSPCSARDYTGTYYSVDGSRMRLEIGTSSHVLYMPDGGRYFFGAYQSQYLGSVATHYIDVNGNKITYDDDPNDEWTDTLGRTIENPLPVNAAYTQDQTVRDQNISLAGIGNSRTAVLSWRYLKDPEEGESGLDNINDDLGYVSDYYCDVSTFEKITEGGPKLFPQQGDDNIQICNEGGSGAPGPLFNPVVLTAITLPNGQSYQFRYNVYGEIVRIVYPTGAYERFVYNAVEPVYKTKKSYDQANRGVTDRYVSPSGSGGDEIHWSYSISAGTSQSPAPYTVTVTAPDSSRTEQDLYYEIESPNSTAGNPKPYGFGSINLGRPYEERTYSTDDHLMKRRLIEYAETSVASGVHPSSSGIVARRDLRPVREVSIIFEPGASHALATMTETTYDTSGSSDPLYFSSMNPKQVKTYSYIAVSASSAAGANLATAATWFSSVSPAVVNETDYLYDSNYKARNINGLVTESRSVNPTNSNDLFAKSQFLYDEASYFDNSFTTTNWQDPQTSYRGNITTAKTWNKDSATWIESHTMFDNFGNVRKVWDTSGDPTRFIETEYSSTNKYAYATKTKAPPPDPTGNYGTNEGSEITRTFDFDTGLILSVTDANGQTATTEYDDVLRIERVNPPAGGSVSEVVYNDTPGDVWVKRRQQIDENNWAESTTYFDGLGRAKKARTKDRQGDVMAEIAFDSFGRLEKKSNPYRVDTNGNPAETVYWSKVRYDHANRVVETYAPAPSGQTGNSLGTVEFGISTLTNLVGTYVTATDASGRKSRAISGVYGLMRVDEATGIGGTTDQDLGTLGSPTLPTSYSYNIKGELVKITQGSQNRYFMYDSLGRLIRVRQPEQTPNASIATTGNTDNNSWTAGYAYDVFGNVISMTDAKNTTITNQYDKAGRTVKRTYSDGTPQVEFFYDGKGLPSVPQFSKGSLTKVTSSVSEDRFTAFDNHGRLLASEQRTDGQTYAFGYEYNLSGGLVEQTYPSGRVVRNYLDDDGGLSEVTTKAAGGLNRIVASNFDYSATGAVRTMKLGNGLWETAQFDQRHQLTQVGLGTTQTNNDLFKIDYEYGELQTNGSVDVAKNIGNIAKTTTTIPTTSFVQTFKYDSINRLVEAVEKTGTTQNWKQTFGYDRYGNRTSFYQIVGTVELATSAVTKPTIDAANNRFTTGQGYVYDYNGNLVQDAEGRTFTFNGDDKQTEVRNTATNQVIGQYFYDGSGARVKKVVPGTGEVTVFVYDAGGALAAEYSTVEPPDEPTTSYLTTDHLGSPRVITDAEGEVIARRDFMPFGEELHAGIGPRTENLKYSIVGSDNLRKRFTGYEKDDETGLDFAEARMYQNKHGRFTAPDPLLASATATNPQTFNRYIYTGNNPVKYADASGLKWCRNKSDGAVSWSSGTCSDGQETIDDTQGAAANDGCTVGVMTSCYRAGSVIYYNSDGTTSLVSGQTMYTHEQVLTILAEARRIIASNASVAAADNASGHTSGNRASGGLPRFSCPPEDSACGSGNVSPRSLGHGASADEVLDAVQSAADAVGLIPVLGEPADAVSGLISLGREDYFGAGLSLGALALPIGGQAAGGAKLARRLSSAADVVHANSKASTRAQHGYEVFVKGERDNVVATGISSGPITQSGKSYRANRRLSKMNKSNPDMYDAAIVKIIPEGPGARVNILDWEIENADKHRETLLDIFHKRP